MWLPLNGLVSAIAVLAAVLSVIEVPVLVTWLRLTGTAPAIGAVGFLFAGILVEELIRYNAIKRAFPRGRALQLVVLGVAVETVGWILPVMLRTPAALTFGLLFVFLEVEHAIMQFAVGDEFDLRGVLDFSAVEALGGAIWLSDRTLGGIVVLAATSIAEHVQGLRQGFGLRR